MKGLLLLISLLFVGSTYANNNSCRYSNDGYCDDGGRRSESTVCKLGTDLNDCGKRRIRERNGDHDRGRDSALQCVSSGVFGQYANGGGCTAFGCYYPYGGCNAFGCWYSNGECGAFGCSNEAPKTRKACD
jgi:hypothetical protein